MNQKKVEFIESYIKFEDSDYKWNDNHGELIRCKDCKWWHETEPQKGLGDCGQGIGVTTGKWYCADGERLTNIPHSEF